MSQVVHSFSDIMNQDFKQHILKTLELHHKRVNGQIHPLEEMYLSYTPVAEELYMMLEHSEIKRIVSSQETRTNISYLMKTAKRNICDRQHLDIFYAKAVDSFRTFVQESYQLGMSIEILPADRDVYDLSLNYMRQFQLESYDALHLATANLHRCNYFVTMDSDFVHDFYSKNLLTSVILRVS